MRSETIRSGTQGTAYSSTVDTRSYSTVDTKLSQRELHRVRDRSGSVSPMGVLARMFDCSLGNLGDESGNTSSARDVVLSAPDKIRNLSDHISSRGKADSEMLSSAFQSSRR